MSNPAAIDALQARNNTLVVLVVDGQRVGRIQQFSEQINNNVQVLAELGRAYMVEMQKGITQYSFSIASFYCHQDIMDRLKLGAVFGLSVQDLGNSSAEVLEYFPRCMITSLGRDYTVGQAAIGQSAQVLTVGKGVEIPTIS
jgi:hypothetical protein